MKKVIIISAIFISGILLSSFVFLQNSSSPASKPEETKIQWHTFKEAVELSKKEKKKIFIDIYTQWCGWCKVLERNTFSNSVIAKYLSENFYCVKLDAEMKDTIVFNNYTFVNQNPTTPRSVHQLASSLLNNKMGYPSMVFLDENFNMLYVLQSYLAPDKLEPYLKFAGSNAYQNTKWDDYQKTFKGEITEPAPSVNSPH